MEKGYIMAKKVNMATADRQLSVRVSEFMTFHMSAITDKKRHQQRIDALNARMASHKNLADSAIVTPEQVDALIAEDVRAIDAENAEYKKACDAKEQWIWYAEDVELYKAINSGDGVEGAVKLWLAKWGIITENTTNIVKDIVDGTKGLRMASARTIVNSGAETWTKARTKIDVLKTVYAIVAEYMVKARTLQPVQIPEDIRAAFAPKQKKADK